MTENRDTTYSKRNDTSHQTIRHSQPIETDTNDEDLQELQALKNNGGFNQSLAEPKVVEEFKSANRHQSNVVSLGQTE